MRRLQLPFLVSLSVIVSLVLYAGHYDAAPLTKTFLDRNGRVIGTLDPAYQGIQYWTPLDQIPPGLVAKTIVSEDRWFFLHHGINTFSIAKAAFENLIHGRVIRGGSTITQQLAKNLMRERGSRARTFFNKFRESLLALGLEMKHDKSWIIERYLNTVYYGRRSYGIAAAAESYFGKTLNELTNEEANLLVARPKAPNRTPSPGLRPPSPLDRGEGGGEGGVARHFLEWASHRLKGDAPVVRTTLDLDLQTQLETATARLLAGRASEDPKLTAAVTVIDVRSGEILAMVGSRDYFDETIDGQVNAAVALRQPGSTLKPFTYFAAFAKGFGPNSIVSDEPASFQAPGVEEADSYAPQNFDRRYHGRMTIREALANSYNVPAVVTLNEIGLSFFHEVLKRFGFTSFNRPPPFYGLAVTLGSGEVTLLELTNAYAALARGGSYFPYRFKSPQPPFAKGGRGGISVIPNAPQFAADVTSILSDSTARLKAFGFNEEMTIEGHAVAVKTGTSYEHRDNWTIGYTPSYAVGVWVGHADGSPMTPMDGSLPTTGATGAAPLWHAAMENLLRGKPVEAFSRPSQPMTERVVRTVSAPSIPRNWRLLNPIENSTFRMSAMLPREHQKIRARADGNTPLTWYLDGRLLATTNEPRPEIWLLPEPGRHRLRVESPYGEKQEVTFKVLDSGLENL